MKITLFRSTVPGDPRLAVPVEIVDAIDRAGRIVPTTGKWAGLAFYPADRHGRQVALTGEGIFWRPFAPEHEQLLADACRRDAANSAVTVALKNIDWRQAPPACVEAVATVAQAAVCSRNNHTHCLERMRKALEAALTAICAAQQ